MTESASTFDASDLNALKLARIHAMSEALIGELHEGGLDERSRARLEQVTEQALVEMGSAVPDPLLEELGRLFRPSTTEPSEAELRIVWAQMLGWIHGIVRGDELDALRPPVLPPPAADAGRRSPLSGMSPYL